VNIVRDSSGVIASKLFVEKDNPRADVVWGAQASNALLLDSYGIFKGYKSEELDKIDKSFYDQKNSEPHWVGLSTSMTAITVNEIELEARGLDIPRSYKDLLKPEYKDLIVMPNPASSGTGFFTVSAILQLFGDKGWKFLDELDKNMAEYTHSGSAPAKQAATAEYAIGVGMDFTSLELEKKNSQITTVFPLEGSGWDIEVLALVNKEKIKDEAKIFYQWALSDEVMELYSKNRSMVTKDGFKSKFEEQYPNGIKAQMIENNLELISSKRNEILKEWEKRYGVGE
ncbi:MAG: extracellular solute-binding protein, partial [Sarcina sp.]